MHRARPTFSVLVATYNHEAYLLQALESVAAQSFKDYEVVIIDDGSTDRTPELLAAWKEEFSARCSNRVVILRTENGGQSRAYEHGLAVCEGQYISLLDSDDRWMPDKLEAVHAVAADRPAAAMICHPVFIVDAEGAATGHIRPRLARLSHGDLRVRVRRTGRTVAAVTSGVTVRAQVLRELLPIPIKKFPFGADGYITTGASLRGSVEVVGRPLAWYRVHPKGQYVRRMLSEDGPRLAMEVHSVVARHLGIEEGLTRSSYFTRHAFADAKFHAGLPQQLRAYGRLLRATALDDAFGLPARIALSLFWTVCLAAPRAQFLGVWRWFQLRHVGLKGMSATPLLTEKPAQTSRQPEYTAGKPRDGLKGLPKEQTTAPSVRSYRLLGVTVHGMVVGDLYATIEEAVQRQERRVIGNHNLHSIYLYHHDPGMRQFYDIADRIFIDGMPIVLLGRLCGLPLRRDNRFTSVDWLPPLLQRAAAQGWRVFLLGSRPGVAERAADCLQSIAPGLEVATAHGYFDSAAGSEESEAILTRIRHFRPQLLIVGMGMPRQERWISENRERIESNVIMDLGAVIDYLAGVVPPPPRWIAPIGFEWLGRFACEPRRLWRRYLIEPWFLLPLLTMDFVAGLTRRITSSTYSTSQAATHATSTCEARICSGTEEPRER